MAFATKQDFSGLSTKLSGKLLIRNDTVNLSAGGEYKPTGQIGDFVELEEYGLDGSPSNNFAVVADIATGANDIALGDITAVTVADHGTKKFALTSLSIATAGGAEPTVATGSNMAEDAATSANSSKYYLPPLNLKKRHAAQVLFDAFEFSGGIELVGCSAEASCGWDPTRVEGVTVASDVKEGQIVVTANFLRKGDVTATYSVAAKSGWTKQLVISPDNPEESKPTFSVTFTKLLTRVDPVVES